MAAFRIVLFLSGIDAYRPTEDVSFLLKYSKKRHTYWDSIYSALAKPNHRDEPLCPLTRFVPLSHAEALLLLKASHVLCNVIWSSYGKRQRARQSHDPPVGGWLRHPSVRKELEEEEVDMLERLISKVRRELWQLERSIEVFECT